MGAVHVGGLLLPYFSEQELFVGATAALLAAQPHYALDAGRAWGAGAGLGCVLCLERDCQHGGHCADVRSSYACACPPGYAGDFCQLDVDECAAHQCQNGAVCKDGVASYTCICPDGFEGDFCERDIDECASSPCLHGGTCKDAAGGYSCACAPAWHGPTCAAPRDRTCAHRPCAPAASACVDAPPEPATGNNFTCVCNEGFEGVYCEYAFCEVKPCVHGTCVNDTKIIPMTAIPTQVDVELSNCSRALFLVPRPAVVSRVLRRNRRIDTVSSGYVWCVQRARCECALGYEGRWCEAERDACAEGGAAACLHGGRCLRAPGDYSCDCHNTGWTGARCELDVDECAAGLVSCGPGHCLNLNGSYTCLCAAGFCGIECSLKDPCYGDGDGNSTGPCLHGGRCEQRCGARTDYVCHCEPGWTGHNCSQPLAAEASGGAASSTVLIGVGAALLGLALVGAALGALGAQARRKRATRGTYSPSGQEYCNPRAEMMQHALKPPPEERLI
ncbi:hypothetical protein HF086_010510 [Spodoptera exigua]|uniref:EGF-like domain-containing protein n=1 Tax=Spodoptera exigua TaxID=7107 RepID=A0A922MSK3_SPOEX|nr:hypothetical protein HF086_010510 [Spodoptera exigua]